MASACYPWFHSVLAPLLQGKQVIVPSGCGVNTATGNVECPPETMRARSEAWLAANQPAILGLIGGRLTLDVYTFARYIHSEVGSGTAEERVAVGEAALNQARTSKRSIYQLLTPSGYYGPIHAPDSVCTARGYNCAGKSGVCCNPYGRWAATSRDPSVASIVIAWLVVDGQTNNFANDAVTQWGPEAWVAKGQAHIDAFVSNIAKTSKYYWVGPLPGVDPWHTFLVFKSVWTADSTMGRAYIQRGQEALQMANGRPIRPAWGDLPVCSKSSNDALIALGLVGTFLGAWAFHRGIIRRVGQ